MALDFPSRFLKKLDIYQQIRSGQGISKHKRLWKYEAAFLQTAYDKSHQHLNSFLDHVAVIDWVKQSCPDYTGGEYEAIIANLFWRGFLEARNKVENPASVILLNRNNVAMSNKDLVQNNEFRPTVEGLLIGEIQSEINNKNKLLARLNRYKYNLVLDSTWLVVLFAMFKLAMPDDFITQIQKFSLEVCSLEISYGWLVLITVTVAWPLMSWLLRATYSAMESDN